MRAALLAIALLTPYLPLAEAAAACDLECNKAAAVCVDACEAQFKGDPAQRVGCKVKCAEKRVGCAKACSGKLTGCFRGEAAGRGFLRPLPPCRPGGGLGGVSG